MLRALVFAVLLFASAAHSQVLWQGASMGMSPAEVRSAFPEAVENPRPSPLRTGANGLLIIPQVDVAGSPFQATFFFLNDKLTAVQLHHGTPAARDLEPVTEKVIEALRAKYGSEITLKSDRGLGRTVTGTWVSGRTSISLFAWMVGSGSLNVTYSVRVAEASDKL